MQQRSPLALLNATLISSLALALILGLAASCGEKKNVVIKEEVAASTIPTTTLPTTATTTANNAIQFAQYEAKIKAKYPCRGGINRINYSFYQDVATSPVSLTIPAQIGAFKVGEAKSFLSAGFISQMYVGILPNFNDLLIVRDYAVADQIIGREMVLSFCGQPPIIMAERPIQIQMSSQVILKASDNCVVGKAIGQFMISGPTAYLNYGPFQAIPQVFAYPTDELCQ